MDNVNIPNNLLIVNPDRKAEIGEAKTDGLAQINL
jgi:hypothetical protein